MSRHIPTGPSSFNNQYHSSELFSRFLLCFPTLKEQYHVIFRNRFLKMKDYILCNLLWFLLIFDICQLKHRLWVKKSTLSNIYGNYSKIALNLILTDTGISRRKVVKKNSAMMLRNACMNFFMILCGTNSC
jgi:hypothetical protein